MNKDPYDLKLAPAWGERAVRTLNSVTKWIDRSLIVIAGIALVIMMLLISISALTRHFFSSPINGSEVVVAVVLAPLITYFAASSALENRQHVGVTAVVSHLPRKMRRWSQILAALLAALVFGVLAYQGWNHAFGALVTHQVETNINVPLFYAYVTVPIGCAAVALRALAIAITWSITGATEISLARKDESSGDEAGS